MPRKLGLKRWHWLFFAVVVAPSGIRSAADLGEFLGYITFGYLFILLGSKTAQISVSGVKRLAGR